MNKPIVFESNHGQDTSTFNECLRLCATFQGHGKAEKANAYRDYLLNEHKGGRVAQGHCRKGHACDRDRIHRMLRDVTESSCAILILCADHDAEWKSERARTAS